jgi:hypothetical protein
LLAIGCEAVAKVVNAPAQESRADFIAGKPRSHNAGVSSRLPCFGAVGRGRADGPSLAQRRSLGIHAERPTPRHLRSASRCAIGGACEICVLKSTASPSGFSSYLFIADPPQDVTLSVGELARDRLRSSRKSSECVGAGKSCRLYRGQASLPQCRSEPTTPALGLPMRNWRCL